MNITIPELSLVVLIGVSGSGKSTFARKHFKSTEVLSSDFCRGLVSDDENSQHATNDAFDVLHYIVCKRLKAGRLTVIDATNVRPEDRRTLVTLAREYHCLPVALVLNPPEKICHERNKDRQDRDFGPHVIRNQRSQLRRGLKRLKREGFRHVHIFNSIEAIDEVAIERTPLWNNKKEEKGPLDIIGDIHGCFDELQTLLEELGYQLDRNVDAPEGDWEVSPPVGEDGTPRKIVFVGDLVDRGPKTPATLRLAMRLVVEGKAYCVPGNHDIKLMRKLRGKNVQITHGLADSLQQLESEPPEFIEQVIEFLDGLVSHYVFDCGRLVVAHAGLREEMQGRGSGRVRDFCLYGETTGETDEFGLPVRYNWASEYRGDAVVVYGHTPVPEPEWLNNTINIDTGCVFGGSLTALRYPEKELASIKANALYTEPARPFLEDTPSPTALSAQQEHDEILHISDVSGKRIISSRLQPSITIREENATAALEVMSRFAVDPKWLMYLPPTMSPTKTSDRADLLEHPEEAFSYYRAFGMDRVVCEEKHMGSRAVVILCRNGEVARTRFGITTGESGICYTRTGRRFFSDAKLEASFLDRIRCAADAAAYWEALQTDWICLDCELMPWSAKAQALLRDQYAAVGIASTSAISETIPLLELAAMRSELQSPEMTSLLNRYRTRLDMAKQYIKSYRQYCWPVNSLDDMKLAPFHILATEGAVHTNMDHVWHMETLADMCRRDPILLTTTPFKIVDLTSPESQAEGIAWWEELTDKGGEGMVVKPFDFIARGRGGVLQPAIKCRGREYLRIIYGPEYTMPEHLERLRSRGVHRKRSLALREFALGIEALDRFVRREPLRRIHECVFGVLAMESEPVDPRL